MPGEDSKDAIITKLEQELAHLRKAICIINHLAGHELNIENALKAIRQVALDLLGCEKVTLFLVFRRQQELRGTDLECGHDVIRVKYGEGIAGTVAQTGKLMNVPDAYAHPLFHAQVDRVTGFRTRNILCASITDMNGRIVAVLQALNKYDGEQFTSADEHNIQLFSTYLGNTLSKAKLHDKALREKQRLSDLYQTFKALSGAGSLDEVLDLASCALHGILHASFIFVFLLDNLHHELWTNYSVDNEEHRVRLHLGHGLVGKACMNNQTIVMCGRTQTRRSASLPIAESPAAATAGSTSPTTAAASTTLVAAPAPVAAGAKAGSSSFVASAALASGKATKAGRAHLTPATAAGIAASAQLLTKPVPSQPLGAASPGLQCWGQASSSTEQQQSSQQSSQQQQQQQHSSVAQQEHQRPHSPFKHQQQQQAHSPSPLPHQQQTVDLASIDPHLLRQLAPALQGEPVRSLLVQPLAADDKVVGAILAINKNDSENDMFFEDCFTESDSKAMALFAYEISQILAERSLECALASAMSVVSCSQTVVDGSSIGVDTEGHSRASLNEAELMLRSQMLTMYYQIAPEKRHPTYNGTSSVGRGSSKSQVTQSSHVRFSTLDTQTIHRRACSSDVCSAPVSPYFTSADSVGILKSRSSKKPVWHMSQVFPHLKSGHLSSKVRSHAIRHSTWSEAGYSTESDTEHEAFLGDSSHMVGMAHSSNEGRSFLDDAAPWVGLGCRSSSSNSSSSEGSSCHGSMGRQQKAQQMSRPMEEGADQSRGMPIPGRTFLSGPCMSPKTSSPRTSFTSPRCTKALSFKLSASQVNPSFHQQHLSRTALSGSRRASLHASCPPTPLPPPAAAATLQQEPALQGSSCFEGGSRLEHPAAQGVWRGRADCNGAATHFPPESLCSWHYDFTDWGTEALINLCEDIFMLSGVVEDFALDLTRLRSFLATVARHYNNAPYHNFNHAAHVLHATWMLLGSPSVQQVLNTEHNLALLIAALCHDLDHDGFSNSYHVNIQSPLATLYNDISVQENHHCATCFAILRSNEVALLEHTDADLQRRLRKSIVSVIMSTDMAKHFEICQALNQHPPVFDGENEADQMLLMKALLHAADIGNSIRPFRVNEAMSRRVHEEFEVQAQKEAAAGIPITFAVDTSNPRMCAQVELNFLDYVVSPLWTRLVEVMPEFSARLDQLKANRQRYEELAGSEP